MAKRGGLGISVKMILTTTLLIVVTVVGFGVLNVMGIRTLYDQTSKRQTETFRAGREVQGEVGTPLLARAVEQLLIDRGRDADIVALVQRTVLQDSKDEGGRKDFGLKLALVLDLNQGVVVACDEGAECKQGNHDPVGPGHGALAAGAWKGALAAWQAAAASGGDVLVKFDLTEGGARYRAFGLPVFVGEAPTAAATVAAEAPPARQGYLVLAYDLAPIDWFAAEADRQKATESQAAALRTGAVGALFVLIGTLLAIFQGLSISKPLKQLAWRADQIARGDLSARVEVKSGDEIGVLGENFNFMADQIAILLEQTAEKARIEQELEVAKTIQDTLVPSQDPVTLGVLSLAGYFQPAAQTGGDWWTYHDLGGGKVLVVIGDVTGHGVPSAMITAAAKAACDVARQVHHADVTKLLEIMNYAIYESAKRKFVMTCFASIVDTRARTITYANAGHNFPYLYRSSDGKGEFGSLMIRGNRLGDVAESTYEVKTTSLQPGDILVWYTDGIVECENAGGEEYGEKRFRASVRRAAALDAADLRDAIVADATGFFAETPRKDDITLVVGRIA
ncbi:MAG: SpoIIE family protein phosphatase [Kofleriaceae bacterium]|jgi:serine phosphatase RsbU (regulator of sigma subunit)|nr:SpoIIE family protein phosphatase [Kofleriaceae bacterium]MBP6835881.1 SpoIIE family protein phosphatase [Kofleriaceae bacterium]MBP9203880.1 SpoIIE family protein phosphatase [Kofleriaceae bacterium]